MKTYHIPLLFLATMLITACTKQEQLHPSKTTATLETAVWQLTTIVACPIPIPVPDTLPVPITIKFPKGEIEGFGGCNGFSGQYRTNHNTFTVRDLSRSEKYCGSSSKWEDSFIQHLEASRAYGIKGEVLAIDCGDMGGLEFRLNWKKR